MRYIQFTKIKKIKIFFTIISSLCLNSITGNFLKGKEKMAIKPFKNIIIRIRVVKGLYRNACIKLSFINEDIDRPVPHKGHGNPVKV